MHYDWWGHSLWQKTIGEGKHTMFSALAAGLDGRLYCCGTTRRGEGSSAVNDDWLIACLNPDGKVRWQKLSPVQRRALIRQDACCWTGQIMSTSRV